MTLIHYRGEIVANRYQIIALLGQGGMGTTYSALDLHHHQKVAIKLVSLRQAKDWKILELFEREARVLGSLHHPFVPNYIDYFHIETQTDRTFYLIQELVEGESLAALVERGWNTTEEGVKNIAIQILEILTYIHHLNPPMIHRDIKPQNIMLRDDGSVYLVDFGSVKAIYDRTIIGSNTIVGTYGYIPVEQFEGKIYCASDLYSLGCTLIYLLTHRSPADLPYNQMKIDLSSLDLNISQSFQNWLGKMIEPEVEKRFRAADEALKELSLSQFEQSLRKVKGSQVKIIRTANKLQINIPTYRNQYSLKNAKTWWNGLLVAAFFGIFISYLLGSLGGFLAFVIVLTWALLERIWELTWIWFGTLNLEIKPDVFSLKQRRFLNNCTIKGHSRDLIMPIHYDEGCTIKHKNKRIRIDPTSNCLTMIEKKWIYEEIFDFLQAQYWFSKRNREESEIQ
ncbi:MAG: serine/threonine protein kinase [Spirulina sp.]